MPPLGSATTSRMQVRSSARSWWKRACRTGSSALAPANSEIVIVQRTKSPLRSGEMPSNPASVATVSGEANPSTTSPEPSASSFLEVPAMEGSRADTARGVKTLATRRRSS
ncbi:hypothetical protein ACIBI9_49475 [Nonomuraea sp. NPDC050451]|uniref:hypothetical protein n=1 Tax=Nonomuraea sp. NPDC050451 TaxID=3364364 RepID=UPI0037AEA881